MRMIERAARAMEARLYAMEQSEDGPDCYRRLGMDEYEQLAAAVLEAVRDGSDGALQSAGLDGVLAMSAVNAVVQDYVDYILNEPSND